ncbi:ATP-dependent helicase [Pseudoclavibacter chungangensis]|uniref:DNA 3'-5' helicase n=1 Tax=Pseudoclavibacter chungangensis TaxID=587635 RepID=A0A7J5BPU0_9MICO|nr:ATP-dependent DNA helicase [Pseudoclavibacter chungangensis]KAB1655105.1 ATP-dependent helicase [Pseudoclavibacter chungangensis]NYJ66123.1 DNA helicase-2/ATP-dependent DNA helicase PcrA [Pseudoclavibacter chungangensis]
MSERREITHELLAEALRSSADSPLIVPTDEQRAVIEAPFGPSLVVAGAGSGKTQTMVQRIVWLIARHGVDPASILGLTFTRKAAAELRDRVDRAVGRLREAGLVGGTDVDLPEVATYNAFANRLFTENALVVGQEPDALLLDDAGAFTLMRGIVLRSDDDRLAALDSSVSTIVRGALDLARGMRENGVAPDDLDGVADAFDGFLELPGRVVKGRPTPYRDVIDAQDRMSALRPFARLAASYEAEKRRRGVIEFADQVAAAAAVVERAPAVAEEVRRRAAHVILDEYQDTSVGQTGLLSSLFRGHSIMAVGDPKQSIYGWRGASAGNMRRFPSDFGAPDGPVPPRLTLSVSWRNDVAVLDAANTIAAGIERPGGDGPVDEPLPELRPRSGAGPGEVRATFTQSLDEEAEAIAGWFADAFAGRASDDRPSGAILFRVRRLMPLFADALAARGVPCRIVGLGGLMWLPEIVDLTSLLRVASDPTAGSELIRLLVGSRFALGPADVAALHTLARRLAALDWRMRRYSASVRTAARASVASDDDEALGDALEYVAAASDDDPLLSGISATARTRLVEAAVLVDDVRSRIGAPLVELVEFAIARSRLDLEAAANPSRSRGRTDLDAFVDAVVGFQAAQPNAGLGALLDWLDLVADDDALARSTDEPEPGTVQLMTVHGAKGLEWDLVAVPRCVAGEFPASSREGTGWVRKGVLPYPLRADAADLPRFALDGYSTQKEVVEDLKRLKDEVAERQAGEERRLAYVAITRARSRLLLTGSYWVPSRKRPGAPSPYLDELRDRGLVGAAPERVADEPPSADGVERVQWPREPFRDGGAAVRALADAVERHRPAVATRAAHSAEDARTAAGGAVSSWRAELDLLLAERASARDPSGVDLPHRIAASHFKDLVTDPERTADERRRPMPQRPYRQTRLGTMFHTWVEHHFGGGGGGELLDGGLLDVDPDDRALLGLDAGTAADTAALAKLRAAFERTAWASRKPVEVERSIEVPLGGHTLVCKLDAVFERADGVFEVVDWKTGRAPDGEDAAWERQLQLALYTLAYSRYRGVDARRISAVLVYVAESGEVREFRFDRVSDEAELRELLARASERVSAHVRQG